MLKACPLCGVTAYMYIFDAAHVTRFCSLLPIPQKASGKLLFPLSGQSTIYWQIFNNWINCYERHTSYTPWQTQTGHPAMHTAERGARGLSSTVQNRSALVQAHALFSSPLSDLHTT